MSATDPNKLKATFRGSQRKEVSRLAADPITLLRPSDVLVDGRRCFHHQQQPQHPHQQEGNRRLRALIQTKCGEYTDTSKRSLKHRIALGLVDAVEAQGGRFLQTVRTTKAERTSPATNDDTTETPPWTSRNRPCHVIHDRSILAKKMKQWLREASHESKSRRTSATAATSAVEPTRGLTSSHLDNLVASDVSHDDSPLTRTVVSELRMSKDDMVPPCVCSSHVEESTLSIETPTSIHASATSSECGQGMSSRKEDDSTRPATVSSSVLSSLANPPYMAYDLEDHPFAMPFSSCPTIDSLERLAMAFPFQILSTNFGHLDGGFFSDLVHEILRPPVSYAPASQGTTRVSMLPPPATSSLQ